MRYGSRRHFMNVLGSSFGLFGIVTNYNALNSKIYCLISALGL